MLACGSRALCVALVLVVAVLAVCVRGDALYYGRCWGTVTKWVRNDQGDSHHLELSFAKVKVRASPCVPYEYASRVR